VAIYSTTYDRLLTIAAGAVGKDRARLTDDEAEALNEAPNLALAEIARERVWKHWTANLRLATVVDLPTLLLPSDFDGFTRPDALAFTGGNGFPALTWIEASEIRNMRGVAQVSQFPTRAALGTTVQELQSIAAAPAVGAGSVTVVTHWKYRYRWIGGDGTVEYSDVASSGAFTSKAHCTVSGWPTHLGGTVTLYRTTDGGSVLYIVPGAAALAASTASYNDSTADGSLSTATYPDGRLVSDTILHRQRLEFWPTPSDAWTLAGAYRRAPRTMASLTDAPDCPAALVATLEEAVKIAAFEKFTRPVPDSLRQTYALKLQRAIGALESQQPNKGTLRNIVPGYSNLPQGRNEELASDWGSA